ncbi:MAG: hypothetical protein ACYC4R_03135 [Anaerolineae bacterium]
MSTVRIPGGARGARLADLATRHNPDCQWSQTGTGITITGPRIEITRDMVEQAYWPNATPDPRAIGRFLRHVIGVDPRAIVRFEADAVVVSDEPDVDQPLLVRFPASLKQRLAATAEVLGISQNELVLRAVEDMVAFVEEISRPT